MAAVTTLNPTMRDLAYAIAELPRSTEVGESDDLQQVIEILEGETTTEICRLVSTNAGQPTEQDLEITAENASAFVAACKLYDLSGGTSSTYSIRMRCLLVSTTLTLFNAFSIPDGWTTSALVANQLDNAHPAIRRAAEAGDKDLRGELLRQVYTFSRERGPLHPEFAEKVREIGKAAFEDIVGFGESLESRRVVVFKGPVCSGKSYDASRFVARITDGRMSPADVTLGTDAIKERVLREFSGITNFQSHLVGFGLSRELSDVLAVKHPSLSSVREGWFHTAEQIDRLIESSRRQGMVLEVRDHDGDAWALGLRFLMRKLTEPGAPTPPLFKVKSAFIDGRESRAVLLERLDDGDLYSLQYVKENGEIEVVNREAASALSDGASDWTGAMERVISTDDVEAFGSAVAPYVGQTLKDALETVMR